MSSDFWCLICDAGAEGCTHPINERVSAPIRIHPAPSIPNPLISNPWEEMGAAEISMEIVRCGVRIEAIEHTRKSLLRELERRTQP